MRALVAVGGLVLSLGLGTSSAPAQSYLVHTYTEEDGLPSPQVFSMAQDQSGRMWFATRGGIVAYDGLEWTMQEPPFALGTNPLARLCADAFGAIWVVPLAFQAPVMRFDGREWQTLPMPSSVEPRADVIVACDVTLDEGQVELALGTWRHGLLIWRRGGWLSIGAAEGVVGVVRAIASWQGQLVVLSRSGLVMIGQGRVTRRLTDVLGPGMGDILAVAATDPAGGGAESSVPDLWLVTDKALLRSRGGQRAVPVAPLSLATAKPSDTVVRVVPPNDAFVASGPTVVSVNAARGRVEAMGLRTGLVAEGASDLMLDREGNLWVAGARGVSNVISRRFATYRQLHGLLEDEVTAITEPRPGVLLFGHPHGLTRLENGTFRRYPIPADPAQATPSDRVFDLLPDGRGGAWVAASWRGLGRLGADGTLTHPVPLGLVGLEAVIALAPGVGGGIVVGGGGGALLIDARGAAGTLLPVDRAHFVRRLLRRRDGALLAATAGSGVRLLRGDRWAGVAGPTGGELESTFALLEDRAGRVWVGTRQGLLVLDGEALTRPVEPKLRFDDSVYALGEEPGGALWFGTGRGFLRWDGRDLRRFTQRQGLAGNEANRAGILVDSRGRLWIGTDRGVSMYQPAYDRDPGPPRPQVLAVEAGGLRQPLAAAVTLPAGASSLVLHFEAVTFTDERSVRYRCKLEGLDKDWSGELPHFVRSQRYIGVPPGTYSFHIQAAVGSGPWSTEVASAPITVPPPAWRRPSSLVGLALLGLAVLALGVRTVARLLYASRLEKEMQRRRLAEEGRSRSEELYRDLVERAGVAIAVDDAEGHIQFCNERFAQLFGYRAEEIMQLAHASLVHAMDLETVEGLHRRRVAGEPAPAHYGFKGVRRDGSVVYLEVDALPLREGQRVVGTRSYFWDVSERHRTTEALRAAQDELESRVQARTQELEHANRRLGESEERYRALVENINDLIFTLDRDGVITFVSQVSNRLLGWAPEDLVGQHYSTIIHPEDLKEVEDAIAVTLTGRVMPVEFRLQAKDGSYLYVRSSSQVVVEDGKPVGLRGVLTDYSARRRAETALRESEERYRNLVELAPYGIAVLVGGVIRFVNSTLLRLCGFVSDEQVLGRTMLDLVAAEDRDLLGQRLGHTERRRMPLSLQEARLCRADGSRLDAEMAAIPFAYEGRAAVQLMVRDITESKRTREALTRTQQDYRLLLDSVEGIVWEAEANQAAPDTLRFTFVSERAGRILGFPRESWIGDLGFLPARLHPEDREGVLEARREAIAAARDHELEYRLKAADGHEVWLRDLVTVTVGEDRLAKLRGVMVDITREKHAQLERETLLSELAASARVAAKLLASAEPAAVAPQVLETLGRAARASRCCWYEIEIGPEGAEVARRRAAWCDEPGGGLEAVPEILPLSGFPLLQRRMSRGRVVAGPIEQLRGQEHDMLASLGIRSGLLIPVMVRGRWRGTIGFLDCHVARQWRDEEVHLLNGGAQAFALALERWEHEKHWSELAAVVDQATEGVLITDIGGCVLYQNAAFGRMTGSDANLTIGSNASTLLDDQTPAATREELWSCLNRGEAWRGPALMRRRDGASFTAQVSVSPLHDARGERIGFAWFHVDISDQLQLEEQLQLSQRMEAVGQLAGGVAHDFNNLVAVILATVDLMERRSASGGPVGDELTTLRRTAERAGELTRALLAYSRRQHLERVNLDLNALVEETLPMLRRVIPEHIEIRWEPSPGPAVVRADRSQVEQVLLNLCVNARDAMPRGGVTTIATSIEEIDEAYLVTRPWGPPGEYVRLRVSDTGVGMDAATLEHIFEPFFTTKEVGRGTGLGLATVYGIVKQHSGMIEASSVVAAGSSFDIYLPHATGQVALLPPPPVRPAAQEVVGKTVLVVEDQEDLRRVLARVLQLEGYAVLQAEDGLRAVALLESCQGEVDLIVSDLVMPHLGGLELLERARVIAPRAAFLLTSGYDEQLNREGLSGHEGLAFLAKPYDIDVLLLRIRELLSVAPDDGN